MGLRPYALFFFVALRYAPRVTALVPHFPSFQELYERIRALPEGITGEILEPGLLHTMSRPARLHRIAAKNSLLALSAYDVEQYGRGWWIEVEAEIRFGARLVVPDLSGFRVNSIPALPDENPITIRPDWCCEILSSTTTREDRFVKLPLYAREGVKWVWLIDPDERTVRVFESIDGQPALAAIATELTSVKLPPFDDEPFPTHRLWA